MDGTEMPDSARCVAISTDAALREMILPGVTAVAAPVVVGYVLNDPDIEPVWLHNYFTEPEPWQYSNFLRRIAFAIRNAEIDRIGGGDYVRYLHHHPEMWPVVEDSFREMASHGLIPGVTKSSW